MTLVHPPAHWLAGLLLTLNLGCAGAPEAILAKEPAVTRIAGPFDVKLTPMPPDAGAPEGGPGRLRIDKTFHGELQGTSVGWMLAIRTPVEGSAGYVAMERVEGTLGGRKGTFALQHSGTMARGKQSLTITVVPDSGTGELQGLSGTLDIHIAEGGKHSYVFDYVLP